MSYVVGIDPGLSGAVAFYDRASGALEVADMPTFAVKSGKKTRNELNAVGFAGLFANAGNVAHVFIERVNAMPGQGVVSMFRFGESYGIAQGVVAALRLPISYVTPQKWKATMGLGADKEGARKAIVNLMPQHAGFFARVKDAGRAEAALIAIYGARELQRLAA